MTDHKNQNLAAIKISAATFLAAFPSMIGAYWLLSGSFV